MTTRLPPEISPYNLLQADNSRLEAQGKTMKVKVKKTMTTLFEKCDVCNAPQYVTPDGEHHCGESAIIKPLEKWLNDTEKKHRLADRFAEEPLSWVEEDLDTAIAIIRRQQEALEFYANPDNWEPYLLEDSSGQPDIGGPKVYESTNSVALSALKKIEKIVEETLLRK